MNTFPLPPVADAEDCSYYTTRTITHRTETEEDVARRAWGVVRTRGGGVDVAIGDGRDEILVAVAVGGGRERGRRTVNSQIGPDGRFI